MYTKYNLPIKWSKVVNPTTTDVTVIGINMCGTTVRCDNSKLTQLISATLKIIHIGVVSGYELSRIIGSWTWCLMVRRPALSILRSVYRYIECAGKNNFVLWNSVHLELTMLISISPLLVSDLSTEFLPKLFATDASSVGGGVVTTNANNSHISRLWPIARNITHCKLLKSEKWGSPNFIPSGMFVYRPPLYEVKPKVTIIQPAIKLIPKYNTPVSFNNILQKCYWQTLISHKWNNTSEHINVLESRSLSLLVRWLLSSPKWLNSRTFVLLDSAVLFYSVFKGRSSSSLFPIIRQISSMLLASKISLLPVWIPSEWNPADKPSRCFSGGKVIKHPPL